MRGPRISLSTGKPREWRWLLAALALAILTAPAAAQRQARMPWWERAPEKKVGAYWIKTDLPARDANALARHLNFMYVEYSKRLASLPERSPEKLNVLIFSNRREYLDVLRSRFGVNAINTGGIFFVNPQGSALAFWTENLPQPPHPPCAAARGVPPVRTQPFRRRPADLGERGASPSSSERRSSSTDNLDDRSIARHVAWINVIKQRDRERAHTIPFERDARPCRHDQMEPRACATAPHGLQYAQAWSMVHFLVYGSGGRYVEAFETYLRLLNRGVLSVEAFARAFGAGSSQRELMAAFERKWKDYALASVPSAFATAMERMEFLAEGALELSRREIVPASLDELQEELIRIDFVHVIAGHGRRAPLRADDPAMFTIPKDDLAREQPVIEAEPAKINGLPRRLKRLEEIQRTPPTLRTDHLEPRELEVRWIRTEDHTFRYDIVVR